MNHVGNPEHVDSARRHEPDKATAKAKLLVKAQVGKARKLRPLEVRTAPIQPGVAVIGGGIAGIHASLLLADLGHKVTIIEKSPTILDGSPKPKRRRFSLQRPIHRDLRDRRVLADDLTDRADDFADEEAARARVEPTVALLGGRLRPERVDVVRDGGYEIEGRVCVRQTRREERGHRGLSKAGEGVVELRGGLREPR